MNSRIAWWYERWELWDPRLFRTAAFDCSRSGRRRTDFGVRLFFVLAMPPFCSGGLLFLLLATRRRFSHFPERAFQTRSHTRRLPQESHPMRGRSQGLCHWRAELNAVVRAGGGHANVRYALTLCSGRASCNSGAADTVPRAQRRGSLAIAVPHDSFAAACGYQRRHGPGVTVPCSTRPGVSLANNAEDKCGAKATGPNVARHAQRTVF